MADDNGLGGQVSLKYYLGDKFETLEKKLDAYAVAIEKRQDEQRETGDKRQVRITELEKRAATSEAQRKAHKEEHLRQARAQVGINSAIAGVLASISAWWGATR